MKKLANQFVITTVISFSPFICAGDSGAKPKPTLLARATSQCPAPKYLMATKWYLNPSDVRTNPQISYTSTPEKWRYGYWGGQNWSDGVETLENSIFRPNYQSGSTADSAMDAIFRKHDKAYADAGKPTLVADQQLIKDLKSLLTTRLTFWDSKNYVAKTIMVYKSSVKPSGAPDGFKQYITFPKPSFESKLITLPFEDYACKQAILAFQYRANTFTYPK